jgi:hypothetical protein
MKRFHVHLHVQDLQASIAFYSRLFSAQPSRVESDYAKWMLEDPRVNFAISTHGSKLDEMKAAAQEADMALLDVGETTCCYAKSEKHWITDPQGIAWEHFHTLANIPVFSQAGSADPSPVCCAPTVTVALRSSAASACCAPSPRGKPIEIAVKAGPSSSCC